MPGSERRINRGEAPVDCSGVVMPYQSPPDELPLHLPRQSRIVAGRKTAAPEPGADFRDSPSADAETKRTEDRFLSEREDKRMKRIIGSILFVACLSLIVGMMPFQAACAATEKEIDASVDVAMERFTKEVKGANEFLRAAKGILILPKVVQAGFVVGGEYGEGALRIGGKSVDYYNMVSGSFGWQIGAQQKDVILVFMNDEALQKFRTGENWQAGVDGTVTLIKVGAEGSIDTTTIKQPIVGFVFGQKGLMAGVSLEGSKFTKLKRETKP